ncbi:phosphatase PAP2 family protein [Candidatus Bathyarchaeota archaeon]|nr:phosphatase PAP2 family protein [Candidatus Bathyarchaeota archaeon]
MLVTFFRASLHSVDVSVNLWVPSIQSTPLTILAEGIAFIFDTTSLVIFSLIIASYLFIKNHRPQSLLLLGAMGGDALLVAVIKNLDKIARPANGILFDIGFSYPSGHCAGSLVFCGVLAYFAWKHWKGVSSRALIGVGVGLIVGVVGFDRLYLNVHWLSDVFGGWLFGAFWLLFAFLVFRQLQKAGKFESKGLGLLPSCFLLGLLWFQFLLFFWVCLVVFCLFDANRIYLL